MQYQENMLYGGNCSLWLSVDDLTMVKHVPDNVMVNCCSYTNIALTDWLFALWNLSCPTEQTHWQFDRIQQSLSSADIPVSKQVSLHCSRCF